MVRLSSIYINEYWNSEEEQEGKCWYSMKDEKVYFINELEERFRGKE